MLTVTRFDFGAAQELTRTPQGFLRLPVVATKPGVFTYRRADGSVIRELRSPEEVFHPDSLASLSLAPVTFEHPPVMVNPGNFRTYARGYLGEGVRRGDGKVNCEAIITDQELMDAIEGGLREVSCGYSAVLIEEPGIFDGQPYDVRQTRIRYNHLAVTKKGRLGGDVRLRLDAAAAVMHDCCESCRKDGAEFDRCTEAVTAKGGANPYAVCTAQLGHPKKDGEKMEKMMLGGKEFEVAPELAAALKTHVEDTKGACMKEMQPKMDSAEAEKVAAVKRAETAEAKADQLTADLAKAKEERTDSVDPVKLAAAVKSRVALERVAGFVLSKEQAAKVETMSDLDLRKAVIKADSEAADLEGKSETYIEVRYDAVAEKVRARPEFVESRSTTPAPAARMDAVSADAAREKMIQESRDSWKTKTA